MKNARYAALVALLVAAVGLGVYAFGIAGAAEEEHGGQGMHQMMPGVPGHMAQPAQKDKASGPATAQGCAFCVAQGERLSKVAAALTRAQDALRAGQQAKAAEELTAAQNLLAELQKAAAEGPLQCGLCPVNIKAVNVRCPIMGTVIDPEKVPDNLVRWYKGQKVGFCCGGCPAAWDKLSDAEKDAKLAAVLPTTASPAHAPQPTMSGHH
jgi:hypothetical protein